MKPIFAIISSKQNCFGIIRISMGSYGYLVKNIIKLLTKKKYIFPRYASRVFIYYKKKVIDDGILIYYPEPNSYTGESCLEFFLHNNHIILYKIVKIIKNIFKKKKIRFFLGKKGEFTFRSFINKKIDIFGVERIYEKITNINRKDIIDYSLRNEKKKKFFIKIVKKINNLIVYIENSLIKNNNNLKNIKNKTLNLSKKIKYIIKNNVCFKKKLIVSIIGETNIGKSTLFNKLIKKNRSIVYNKKGTTRDSISENIKIKDINIKLFDTAGLNLKTKNKIEKIGIKKTIKIIKKSDILLEIISKKPKFNSDIIIINKIDKTKFKKCNNNVFYISTEFNIGLKELFKEIFKISNNILKKKQEKYFLFYNLDLIKEINKLKTVIKINDVSIILSILKTIKNKLNIKDKNILKLMLKKFCIGK
ncbi:GTPase and tRNA-U34 5-formylation enzyme TrmE [Candidatus Vidania fulgoroideae]|uniref:GTPase and tRNA-U34 5-formylation enzyme TrmE n=1 Tax=Candidatus Vidania fulgoroideorum TaxID=881286 RepID=A0A346E0K6_9PROT|nr:GTPase and tRNA-U34 5-formylation enzyme TrmE [Candidatus Vidania fulgoroideae]